MKKYVITGGAGFIGCNVASHHLRRGDAVVVFDNLSRHGAVANAEWLRDSYGDLVTVCEGDVRTAGRVLPRLVEDAHAVFHFAAQVAVTTSVADPRQDFETNALGTFNVLEAVRDAGGGATVIYSSTNKVYGKLEDLATIEQQDRYRYADLVDGVDESRGLDFYSPYGCSKGSADQYVRDYARIYGLKTVVFRQSCVYGPRQFGVEDQGWIAWFAIRALQRLPVTIYGDGKQVRDALFIDDLVAAFDAALLHAVAMRGQVYNIGGGPRNTLSLLELVALLEARLGHRVDYTFDDWRPGDQLVFVSDIRKARNELAWEPKVSVAEGVGRLVTWLQANDRLFSLASPVAAG